MASTFERLKVNGEDWEPRILLKDGAWMPLVGFGTQYGFRRDGNNRGRSENGPDYVIAALRTGFRLVDTARCYGSEAHVMRGIQLSGLDRKQVFVVSKAWPGIDHAPELESSRSAIKESASRIGGYVDLYLVHHPVQGWQSLWRALEDAKDAGLVKSIGVSNFKPTQLDELRRLARYPAVANQILLNPFVYREQEETLRYCAQHEITVIAYPRCPWSKGGTALDEIAYHHNRTKVQIMLRWAIDHGCCVIPLSTNHQHLTDNFAIRDFHLLPNEMEELDGLRNSTRIRHFIDGLKVAFRRLLARPRQRSRPPRRGKARDRDDQR